MSIMQLTSFKFNYIKIIIPKTFRVHLMTLRVPPVEKYSYRNGKRGKMDSSGSGWDSQQDVVYPGLNLRIL
jgi:hypothetical protein